MKEQDDLATQKTIAVETTNLPGSGSLIGMVINERYQIIKRLGSGGMGDVFLAQDKNVMNRERVIKLLKSEALGNREIVRKFRQETEALARLNDPGIVMILDSGTFGKQPFLVLEYVAGEDLSLIISPVLFSVRDFPAPQKLAVKLHAQKDELAKYIRSKFSPPAREILSGQKSEKEKAEVLRNELTGLLADANLYQSGIFNVDKSSMPGHDEDFWENTDEGLRFNRELLENAFAGEIIRGKDKVLSAEEAALIFRQLGTAITHGHEKGIIHRDLKPANIMISRTERGETQVKLIDFGVAKVQESLIAPPTEQGLSFGTRKYMSPEQIAGRELTGACDIYALGLIAFEALTGQHIFRTESFLEQCRMQENEDFSEITVLRPTLPAQVKDIICRAVSFKPENRQASAADFGNELADALLLPVPAKTEAVISGEAKTWHSVTAAPERPVSVVEKPTTAETEILDNRDSFKIENLKIDTGKNGGGKALSVALGALILLVLLGTGSWLIWHNASKPAETTNSNSNSAPAETVKRELNYKLIVQKYQLGKPFQPPFDATGDEIFGDDWRFKMSLSSPQSGNLYLLSENPGTKKLAMLFPHPDQNGGNSAVQANAAIQTGEMAFDKNQGTENFWIVWAEKPVDELEAVKTYVNPQDLGAIKDAAKEKFVRDFLTKTIEEEKLTEKTGANKQSKILQAPNDIIVKMAEFRHN